jgi:uncharacterized protein YdhG (YjbR/CyaY superfamily)
MNDKPKDITEYIAGYPDEIQVLLSLMRETIRKVAPEAVEKISYGMPTFFLKGNLVHFAMCKNHIGFYPTPTGIIAFQKELTIYKTSKGAIQFPMDKPLPLALISEIVKFRVLENMNSLKPKKC